MKKCESCGKLYQENKDVFCPHCGAVAQKQCTHGSSFDSGKYDRGEIYQNSSNAQSAVYTQGVEPHAQREKYPYNRFEDTFGDAGQYSDETPKVKSLFDFTKVKKIGNNKAVIGVIVSVCIIVFNLLAANFSSFDDVDDDYSDYEVVSEVYAEAGEFYPVSSNAGIKFVGEENDYKVFELIIENMNFPYEAVEQATEIKDYIVNGDMFTETRICKFSNTEVPEIVYNIAIEESYCVSANFCEEAGIYSFKYDFDYDEIVHFTNGVSMYFDNGIYVNVELPFSAFSISEDGEVTYYTSYADDSTDWNTIFTECSNKQEVEDYDVCIVFNNEE